MISCEFRITEVEDDIAYQLIMQMNGAGKAHIYLLNPNNMEIEVCEEWQWRAARKYLLKSLLFCMRVISRSVPKIKSHGDGGG